MEDVFHEYFMRLALDEALKAREMEEVPTGALIIRRPPSFDVAPSDIEILSRGHNLTESSHNPTAHAEIIAITEATRAIGDFRLTDTILYVTKEPCAMCAGAIVLARIPMVVWGLSDPKRGGESKFGILSSADLINRSETIRGVLKEEAHAMISSFFQEHRKRRGASQ